MTDHYVCLGECQGVSDKPGTCQAKECSLYQKNLVKCTCTDNKHTSLRKKKR